MDTFHHHQDYEQVNLYKETLFISVVGPSEAGKSHFLYNWLKIGTFRPQFDNIHFFYQHSQPLYAFMQKQIENIEFVKRVNNQIKESLKNNGTKYLLTLQTIPVKKFAIQKRLLFLLLLEDIVDWALFTLSTTCLIKANMSETLSSKTRTLFSSNLPVTWCNSVRLVHSWVSDQSCLIGNETQRLYPTVSLRLNCWREQTIDYVIVQTLDPFLQSFISETNRNSQNFWTMNRQNFSNLQVFQSFSRKCKSLFLQSCPKEFIRFLCECLVIFLKGNLQSIKRQHVANFQIENRLLSLKRTNWKQRRASEKELQVINVITPPVNKYLSWYGAVCSLPCFCVQQQQKFDYSGSSRAGASQVICWTKTNVPKWLTQKGNKQKTVCLSRILSRQNVVFSSCQALKFANFSIGWCRNLILLVGFCSTT